MKLEHLNKDFISMTINMPIYLKIGLHLHTMARFSAHSQCLTHLGQLQ